LVIRSNQELRKETLNVFERTFTITWSLQVVTVVVAFVGILSAMMSLEIEKRRQYGILRAVGFTGKQIWGLILLETGLMGMIAGILAMPTGYILAWILIQIINKRSFGWTLIMQLDSTPFLFALFLSIVASILAGLYPAWSIVNERPAETIRYE